MTTTKPKAAVSWSSGKDSAFALAEARLQGELDIVCALTTVTTEFGRVSMHGVREAILDAQMSALGLPCRKVPIPWPCSNEIYEAAMADAVSDLKAQGVERILFGDLFLEDLRRYREENLARVGMQAVFPLWMRDTRTLAQQMIEAGVEATVVCIDPRLLERSFAGRAYDTRFLADLPPDVDPCGENGEFHTVVTASPGFDRPIATEVAEVVEREGFVYADVRLSPLPNH